MCQKIKNRIKAPVGKLIAGEVSKKLQTYLIVDFITKILLVVEKNIILVVCNKLSKTVHFVTTIKEILVEELVRLFKSNM